MEHSAISNLDGFQRLAPYNDTFFANPDPLENDELKLIAKYLGQLPASGNRFVDIGCGTGDLCFFMANEGYNVTGIDFSDNMLLVARNKLALFKQAIEKRKNVAGISEIERQNNIARLTRVNPKIRFLKDDITKLSCVNEQFNLACMINTLAYIRPEEVHAVLKNVNKLLFKDAILLFNVTTPVEYEHAEPADLRTEHFDCRYDCSYDPAGRRFTASFSFEKNELVSAPLVIEFVEYPHQLLNILAEAERCGFTVSKIIPNTPVYSDDEVDLGRICDSIESTFSIPNGVRSVMIALRKY